mgnify:CR=1 FL=1
MASRRLTVAAQLNLPPEPFVLAVLFGANILFMFTANRLNVRLLSRLSPPRLLRIGIGIQLCAAILLVSALALGLDLLYVIAPLLMVFVGANGMVAPNAISSALQT